LEVANAVLGLLDVLGRERWVLDLMSSRMARVELRLRLAHLAIATLVVWLALLRLELTIWLVLALFWVFNLVAVLTVIILSWPLSFILALILSLVLSSINLWKVLCTFVIFEWLSVGSNSVSDLFELSHFKQVSVDLERVHLSLLKLQVCDLL